MRLVGNETSSTPPQFGNDADPSMIIYLIQVTGQPRGNSRLIYFEQTRFGGNHSRLL